MYKAVKVALDPTPRQERMLRSHAGAARVAFNKCLAHVKDRLESGEPCGWSMYSLRSWWNANKDGLAPWWPENSKEAYNAGIESLARALANWLESSKGRRKGPKVGFPRFRSRRKATPRFAYTTGSFGPVDGDPHALRLPRIGRVHCFENVSKRVGGRKVTRMTISLKAGRWYASLSVEEPEPKTARSHHTDVIGVNLGVKTLAVLSDGTEVPNPRNYDRGLKRLAKAQRTLARRKEGSAGYWRARRRVQRVHARIAAQRRDGLDKLALDLVRNHGVIAIESLNVRGMMANHRLARSIGDAGFAMLAGLLEAKAPEHGIRVFRVDRWYPSSKKCSNCGRVKAKLGLDERTYVCEGCGLRINRDLNAAINLRHVAMSAMETLNARGGDVSRSGLKSRTTRTPVKREPSGDASRVRLGAGLGNGAMRTTSL